MKYLILVITSTSLLSCNQDSYFLNIDAFNNRMIYSIEQCNNDITIYTKNIKNELHQVDNLLSDDKSICSIGYELGGKPLKSSSTSMGGERVYTYVADGSYYKILDKNNNLLVKFILLNNNNGQVVQKLSDTDVIDYTYNENKQLDSVVYYRDSELFMTYTYQWKNGNVVSSCFIKNMLTIYTEYSDNNIISYKSDNGLPCAQVKQRYLDKGYDELKPITKYLSQCEEIDYRGNCINSKSFINDVQFSQKHSLYEYN